MVEIETIQNDSDTPVKLEFKAEPDEKVENCRIAMKAALEAIHDYCGTPAQDFSFPDARG